MPACPVSEKEGRDIKWVHLATVANNIEFETMASLLRIADIPAVSRVKGVDGFLQVVIGLPINGIEVLVPEDKLDEAVELINTQVDETAFDEEKAEE